MAAQNIIILPYFLRLDTHGVPYLRPLVSGLPKQWLDPRSVHVGFVVDKVVLGQGFSVLHE
jgi:hypothetical protein